MVNLKFTLLVAPFVVLAFAGAVKGGAFSFITVADTSMPIPGGVGDFTSLLAQPSADLLGNVAFIGDGVGQEGVYESSTSALNAIANKATEVPGAGGQFGGFNNVSVSLGQVAFRAYSNSNVGIYTNTSGSLTRVADTTTLVPGGGGTFNNFGQAGMSGNASPSAVAFDGQSGTSFSGIYTGNGGALTKIADTNTPQPGGLGNFGLLADPSVDVGNTTNNVVFWGRNTDATVFGIYRSAGGSLGVVADTNTPVPNVGGTFSNIQPFPSIGGGSVSFHSYGTAGSEGIYVSNGGSLLRAADNSTAVPGGTGNFVGFDDFTGTVGTTVAFMGFFNTRNTATEGIYLERNGLLGKVIAAGDQLDGKTVSQVVLGNVISRSFPASGLVFSAGFTDGSSGVYTADRVIGDVNMDGIVNGQDISLVASHWLQSPPIGGFLPGDENGDSIVNGIDVATIASHWLWSPAGPPVGGGAPVPEPSALTLLSLGICLAIVLASRASLSIPKNAIGRAE